MSTESIPRRLAKFILAISYETLPHDVIRRTKNLILDSLGTAIAGCGMSSSRMAFQIASRNVGCATVIGHDEKVPVMDAIVANSVSISALALDDFLFSFHPGQVNVPTAMALGEEKSMSGAQLLVAVVAGYEAMGRIYLGGPKVLPKFRNVSIFGPFGAAVTAAKLLGLNESQLTNALSLAGNFASGLTQCFWDGTMEGYFHGGVAARNGVTAARLAEVGAIASEQTLQGECGFYQAYVGTTHEAETSLEGIGKKFLIMDALYKPYPVCGHQQIPIDLMLRLAKRHSITAGSVREIVEKVPEVAAAFPGSDFAGPFQNPGQTLLSSQFCAAAALLGRPVKSYNFYIDNYNDQEILALGKKVRLVGEKDRKLPEITVTLDNGTVYRIEETETDGTLVPADGKTEEKFEELVTPLIGEDRTERIFNAVMSLEKMVSVRELADMLGQL